MFFVVPLKVDTSILPTNTVKSPTVPNSNQYPTKKPPLNQISLASSVSNALMVPSYTTGKRQTISSQLHSEKLAPNRKKQQNPRPHPSTKFWNMSQHTPTMVSHTYQVTYAYHPTLMPHTSIYPTHSADLDHRSYSSRRIPNQGTMAPFSPFTK